MICLLNETFREKLMAYKCKLVQCKVANNNNILHSSISLYILHNKQCKNGIVLYPLKENLFKILLRKEKKNVLCILH